MNELAKCIIGGCGKEARLLVGNVFVCGDCYTKNHNKVREAINQAWKDIVVRS